MGKKGSKAGQAACELEFMVPKFKWFNIYFLPECLGNQFNQIQIVCVGRSAFYPFPFATHTQSVQTSLKSGLYC